MKCLATAAIVSLVLIVPATAQQSGGKVDPAVVAKCRQKYPAPSATSDPQGARIAGNLRMQCIRSGGKS